MRVKLEEKLKDNSLLLKEVNATIEHNLTNGKADWPELEARQHILESLELLLQSAIERQP